MLLHVCYYIYVITCMLLHVCYYMYVITCMLLHLCYPYQYVHGNFIFVKFGDRLNKNVISHSKRIRLSNICTLNVYITLDHTCNNINVINLLAWNANSGLLLILLSCWRWNIKEFVVKPFVKKIISERLLLNRAWRVCVTTFKIERLESQIQWNLSNPTYQGTREMCQIVQDVRTCLARHTKGPGKCVGLYGLDSFWHPVQSDTFLWSLGMSG
jgi:hypothetical protein